MRNNKWRNENSTSVRSSRSSSKQHSGTNINIQQKSTKWVADTSACMIHLMLAEGTNSVALRLVTRYWWFIEYGVTLASGWGCRLVLLKLSNTTSSMKSQSTWWTVPLSWLTWFWYNPDFVLFHKMGEKQFIVTESSVK